ncbi:MAG: hypothetical protein HY203_08135 [Nitrospirae bacterium]|nr:hypothetical protein [Nitrospirota bacterium]
MASIGPLNHPDIGHRLHGSAWARAARHLLIFMTIPFLSGCWGSPSSNISGTFDLKAIAIDPSTPTTLYVGTDGGGVYKSTDGGASWAPINQGLTDLKVTALAIDWFTPYRIYAGTENGGIFSSFDYGESWMFNQAPITDIRAIVIDRNVCPPATPPFPSCQWIFVASQTSGVWWSQNAGSKYSQFNNSPSNVTAMAIYPTTLPNPTGRLYIGTERGGFFLTALHPTLDSLWTEALPGLKANTQEDVVSLAVRPDVISELYVGTSGEGISSSTVGIYKSTDAGTTFDHVYTPNYPFTIYFVVPVVGPNTTDLTLYAGSDGIVRSVDFGNVGSWCILWDDGKCQNNTPSKILQPGLTAFAVELFKHTDSNGNVSFLIDSTTNPPRPTLYAALFNRQFIKTTDGGQTWTTLSVK